MTGRLQDRAEADDTAPAHSRYDSFERSVEMLPDGRRITFYSRRTGANSPAADAQNADE